LAPQVRLCVSSSAGAELFTHRRIYMPVSLNKAKEILKDKNLSDEKVEEILSAMKNLSELLWEHWQSKRTINTNPNNYDKTR
jgi:Fe-S cluster biosynthesis and repair protein YggX